ncbi:hypothetical protein O0I10_004471 [Lichtheimia ornata]|uniref:Uncharacterized protein n=1 Tax=Lichtheimia ornata TaxID=688661 RepID=A0AAD7V795_9FUNG|nr:uncharacterized protein O0I10_004471 [Lichtheimia ornata]KAJ8659878.1 hypothetical protein O0I10_004471 [Lichtheimia ornata]
MDHAPKKEDPSTTFGSIGTIDAKQHPHDRDDTDQASLLSTKTRRWLVLRRITYIVIVNAVTPILLYYALKPYLPTVWALVLSSTPTLVSVLIQGVVLRHIDTIGVASICGFSISIILAVVNGDPKLMMMRETAGVGAACGFSLIPIRVGSFVLKPVMYYLGKDLIPLKPINNQHRIAYYWEHSRYCRFHIRLLTAVDIVLLELEFGLKLYYIFKFDIDTVVIASSITWGLTGALISAFTISYAVHILRRLKQDEPKMMMMVQEHQ